MMKSTKSFFKKILLVGLFVILGVGIGFNRCAKNDKVSIDVDKGDDWYNNRIPDHSAGVQDKLWAIAAETGADLHSCEGVKKMQKYLSNQLDSYNSNGDGKIGEKTVEAVETYCSISLNTKLPFLGRCVQQSDEASAFPTLVSGLMKIVLSIFFIVAVIGFIGAGALMAVSGGKQQMFDKGKDLILKIVMGIVIIGLVGIILYMINPNFFNL